LNLSFVLKKHLLNSSACSSTPTQLSALKKPSSKQPSRQQVVKAAKQLDLILDHLWALKGIAKQVVCFHFSP
jgi:hypothetical protein